jgi:capsid portal protein
MNKDSILNKFHPEKIDYIEAYQLDASSEFEKALEIEAKKKLKYKQQKQMHDMVDTQYYACVVFGNKADKEKWLETIKDVEIIGNTFIDGYQLAKNMGVEIEMTATLPEPHYVKQLKIKKK